MSVLEAVRPEGGTAMRKNAGVSAWAAAALIVAFGVEARALDCNGNGIGDAVEEDDIRRGDVSARPLIHMSGESLASLAKTLRGAVAPRDVSIDDVMEDLADPGLDSLALGHRVSDILPSDVDPMLLHHLAELDDVPYRVREVRR